MNQRQSLEILYKKIASLRGGRRTMTTMRSKMSIYCSMERVCRKRSSLRRSYVIEFIIIFTFDKEIHAEMASIWSGSLQDEQVCLR